MTGFSAWTRLIRAPDLRHHHLIRYCHHGQVPSSGAVVHKGHPTWMTPVTWSLLKQARKTSKTRVAYCLSEPLVSYCLSETIISYCLSETMISYRLRLIFYCLRLILISYCLSETIVHIY